MPGRYDAREFSARYAAIHSTQSMTTHTDLATARGFRIPGTRTRAHLPTASLCRLSI
ncbi:hypothetical protein EXIGLDRAFT_720005 [Exidia glandulosa HHB12029]|uniref:Uncharacterized protein n=1 Tax=Exidia glandulosa HHB12029 TaxID=1314781 RepID=A0A165NLW6_EXIGL|nr:hypothetical protein EXIGLDRAFT_720005 [Exidia glandulosa HHB12029]